jgi:redox-sensitive bicupin YhaK (pirin superfamily)
MKYVIQKSEDRGQANHGWLHARFSFSFSQYHNPQRMGFGKLRVLNDDTIAAGKGFGSHPHDNMEIITIPTSGMLAHKDNTGSEETLGPGEIQVMSAGSGIVHSEYNASVTEDLRLFQMWIETNAPDATPRHATKKIDLKKEELTKIVSGNESESTIFIHQDAAVWMGAFSNEKKIVFETQIQRGTFIMVVEGSAIISGQTLSVRDSMEITDTQHIEILVSSETRLLVIDVPM